MLVCASNCPAFACSRKSTFPSLAHAATRNLHHLYLPPFLDSRTRSATVGCSTQFSGSRTPSAACALAALSTVTMPRYKRTRDEAELDLPSLEPEVPEEKQEMLSQLRSMWEFASLMQYIFLFGHVVKIDDDFDIEVWLPSTPWSMGGMPVAPCLAMNTDGCADVGPRARVLEASAFCEACRHRSRVPKIRLVTPWSNVCLT